MLFFFFNDTATTEIYTYCHTLALHDALPIYAPLGAAGRQEAQGAGRVLAAAGYRFELACTSYLSRAAETLDIILEEIGRPTPPVERSWRLNERHYGVLQGHNRAKMAQIGRESCRERVCQYV